MTKSKYLVVGWSRAPDGRLKFAFHVPVSLTPGKDVEEALKNRCVSVDAILLEEGKDLIEQGESYVEEATRVLKAAKSVWPPVDGGATVCDIEGAVPRLKEPRAKYQGTLYMTNFEKKGSTTPSQDVERALQAGSTRVYVSKRLATTSPELL